MKHLHHLKSLVSAAAIAIASLPAYAQSTAAPPAPATAASMPMDCANPGAKRHDHGAERGMPAAAAMPCANDVAASAPRAKTKKKLAHDHAKFHKNM